MANLETVGARTGKHILDCGREVGKRFHKSDDALALLNFDLCILDGPDLFVYEPIKTACEFA